MLVARHGDVVARGVPGEVDLGGGHGGRMEVARRRGLLRVGHQHARCVARVGEVAGAVRRTHLVVVVTWRDARVRPGRGRADAPDQRAVTVDPVAGHAPVVAGGFPTQVHAAPFNVAVRLPGAVGFSPSGRASTPWPRCWDPRGCRRRRTRAPVVIGAGNQDVVGVRRVRAGARDQRPLAVDLVARHRRRCRSRPPR